MRFTIKTLLLVVAAVAIALGAYWSGYQAAVGERGSRHHDSARLISASELNGFSANDTFYYCGSDTKTHIFYVDGMGYYAVPLTQLAIPTNNLGEGGVAASGSISLEVYFRDGDLLAKTVPAGGSF